MSRAVTVLRLAATFVVLSIGAAAILCVALLTLFTARRIYAELMARPLAIVVLRLWGVRYRLHGRIARGTQTVYISNHTSTLDLFLLVALGLPRTRFFLSGFLKRYVPIGIIAVAIGTFWTVPQRYTEQRRRIFRRADRVLKLTGDSVYLSPEGERVTTGEIGRFNRGAFHLATSLRAPIVPLYFSIPRAIDPGRGWLAKPGSIDIYALPAIDTSHWRLADIDLHRDGVRELFVRAQRAIAQTGRLSYEPLTAAADLPELSEAYA